VYAQRIADALAAAVDTRKLAETWQALHPAAFKASQSILARFLAAARDAITAALKAILPQAWTEGWALGQQAAESVTTEAAAPDWGGWTPGDYEAAAVIAGPGLRMLLDNAGIVIQSIAETRLEELSKVLEDTLLSDVTALPPVGEPIADRPYPPRLSVSALAAELRSVLDNPARAELVAQAEIGRAQAEAARVVYAQNGVTEIEISTAHDAKVCPVCEAAAAVGPHPVGVPPMVLLHPRCRCAEIPVLASVAA
jgi:hypothetical protein